jgi:radical SAM-linked protein
MRIRLRFAKLGKVRFTSHRDVARMWERALRRLELPVAYTEGFSPRPKLSFGLALSTGHESVAEYLDVELREEPDLDALPEQLSSQLPVGIDVTAATPLAPGTASLQEDVSSCSWRIEARGLALAEAEVLVDTALRADELIITRNRKGKEVTDDLRPAVLTVRPVGPTPAGTELEAELAVHPRSVRPAELLLALRPGLEEGRVLRTAQWIWRDADRLEPVAARPSREDPDVRRSPDPAADRATDAAQPVGVAGLG